MAGPGPIQKDNPFVHSGHPSTDLLRPFVRHPHHAAAAAAASLKEKSETETKAAASMRTVKHKVWGLERVKWCFKSKTALFTFNSIVSAQFATHNFKNRISEQFPSATKVDIDSFIKLDSPDLLANSDLDKEYTLKVKVYGVRRSILDKILTVLGELKPDTPEKEIPLEIVR